MAAVACAGHCGRTASDGTLTQVGWIQPRLYCAECLQPVREWEQARDAAHTRVAEQLQTAFASFDSALREALPPGAELPDQ